MKNLPLSLFLAGTLAGLFPTGLRAEVTIQDVGWQLALQVQKQKKIYHDISQWLFPPSPKLKMRPRAVASLVNSSGHSEIAVLLRYTFSARLREIGGKEEGTWTVPFVLEEQRIPNIRANSTKRVHLPINRVALKSHLDRMYRAGFWPDAFRVRVMVEPRPKETFGDRIKESLLPILWKVDSPNGSKSE